jgi:hypothetical protein
MICINELTSIKLLVHNPAVRLVSVGALAVAGLIYCSCKQELWEEFYLPGYNAVKFIQNNPKIWRNIH